jgi:hypothetical protein
MEEELRAIEDNNT